MDIGDIKIGDRLRIKEKISNRTSSNISLNSAGRMNALGGQIVTVKQVVKQRSGVYVKENQYIWDASWLEPEITEISYELPETGTLLL
jgi:hypothetical protein